MFDTEEMNAFPMPQFFYVVRVYTCSTLYVVTSCTLYAGYVLLHKKWEITTCTKRHRSSYPRRTLHFYVLILFSFRQQNITNWKFQSSASIPCAFYLIRRNTRISHGRGQFASNLPQCFWWRHAKIATCIFVCGVSLYRVYNHKILHWIHRSMGCVQFRCLLLRAQSNRCADK